jgi:esterase/lipase superfamily enzyme
MAASPLGPWSSTSTASGPPMTRDYHRWYSRSLGRDMELLVFGHAGPPVVVFPTSMGAFFEFEDRGMVEALRGKLDGGGLQLFCVSSVDGESWYARGTPAWTRVERHLQYESYILGDVVPLIRQVNGTRGIGVTGCSFGAYHAMAMALRHPYIFTSCITISGAFDISQFLDGWRDRDAYLLNPPWFLPALDDAYYLDQYRRNKFVLATGEWDICRAANQDFSRQLAARGIPHSLHVWGFGAQHDWPHWRPMASAYLP